MNKHPDDATERSKSQPEVTQQAAAEIPVDFLEQDGAELALSADQVARIEGQVKNKNTSKLAELAALLERPKG
jgi:hypothetical protein